MRESSLIGVDCSRLVNPVSIEKAGVFHNRDPGLRRSDRHALLTQGRWESWGNLALLNLLLGALVFISPLLFHYNDNNPATWIHMLGGIAVGALAYIQMWRLADLPHTPTTLG